jgi:hypothetical protein
VPDPINATQSSMHRRVRWRNGPPAMTGVAGAVKLGKNRQSRRQLRMSTLNVQHNEKRPSFGTYNR